MLDLLNELEIHMLESLINPNEPNLSTLLLLNGIFESETYLWSTKKSPKSLKKKPLKKTKSGHKKTRKIG